MVHFSFKRDSGGLWMRFLAFVALLFVGSWHPDDRLMAPVFVSLALTILDRRGLTIALGALFVALLYHWDPAAAWFGVFGYTFFFVAISGLRPKRAAIVGFGFGAGVAILNLRWLVAEFDASWAGLVLLIIAFYGGTFMAAVAALLRHPLVRRRGWIGLLLTILTLPALDYLRIETPRFGIGNLYSAHLVVANVDLAQAAHWAGAGGLSALLAFCSYTAANWLIHEHRTRWAPRIAVRQLSRLRFGLAIALVVLLIAAGEFDRHYSRLNQDEQPVRIAVIQLPAGVANLSDIANLSDVAKGGDRAKSDAQEARPSQTEPPPENYESSLSGYLNSSNHCDVLFMPEGAISIGEWNDPSDQNAESLMSLAELQQRFGSAIDSFVVTGAMIREQLGRRLGFRNTALSVDQSFNLLGQVDKQFGAPLVETNPFQGIPVLEAIGERATHLSRQMNPQINPAILPIGAGWRSLVAICNEHQLPDIWDRRGVTDLRSINLQLVLSDVSWFDNSEEERSQSRLARRLLAAKYRRPLLYVANNGSEFWDSNGELLHALDARTAFGTWDISLPRFSAENRPDWQPPSEVWPLLIFCTLALCRWSVPRLRGRRPWRPS